MVFVHFRTSALLDEARKRASKTNPNAASLGKTMERDTGNVEHLKETLREFSEAGVLNLIIDDFGGQNYDEIWSPADWRMYHEWAHDVFFKEWHSLSTGADLKPHDIKAQKRTGMSHP